MRLQKNTALALYSVLEFAGEPARHISAAEIAAKYGVSPHHLAKVLAELARAGVVESARGVGGGYRFVGNARRLTLLDVIRMFEDIALAPGRRRGHAGRARTRHGARRDRRERQGDLRLDHRGDHARPDRAPGDGGAGHGGAAQEGGLRGAGGAAGFAQVATGENGGFFDPMSAFGSAA